MSEDAISFRQPERAPEPVESAAAVEAPAEATTVKPSRRTKAPTADKYQTYAW